MPGQVCSCINSYRLFSHNAFFSRESSIRVVWQRRISWHEPALIVQQLWFFFCFSIIGDHWTKARQGVHESLTHDSIYTSANPSLNCSCSSQHWNCNQQFLPARRRMRHSWRSFFYSGYNQTIALANPVFPPLSCRLPMTAHPSQQAGAAVFCL